MSALVWFLRKASDALYTVSSWLSDASGWLITRSNIIVERLNQGARDG